MNKRNFSIYRAYFKITTTHKMNPSWKMAHVMSLVSLKAIDARLT
jgi:hypothetical protein